MRSGKVDPDHDAQPSPGVMTSRPRSTTGELDAAGIGAAPAGTAPAMAAANRLAAVTAAEQVSAGFVGAQATSFSWDSFVLVQKGDENGRMGGHKLRKRFLRVIRACQERSESAIPGRWAGRPGLPCVGDGGDPATNGSVDRAAIEGAR